MVVFTATDGVAAQSYLIVLDAASFEEVHVEQALPERMTFTTHGSWFDGLMGNLSSSL